MNYIDTSTGQVVTERQIKEAHPLTSFPEAFVPPGWYSELHVPPLPEHDSVTHRVESDAPVFINGRWERPWKVIGLDAETIAANQSARRAIISAAIMFETQLRLDDFAKTRGYDGILSACTYASSPTPKFAAEGQYCVSRRDATWLTLYGIMAAVEAGTRPLPMSYVDVEPELPVLEWPS